MSRFAVALGIGAGLLWWLRRKRGSQRKFLQLLQEIPLDIPGRGDRVRGRVDHFTYDPARKYLFVACLGENKVLAVDVFAGCVIKVLSEGLRRPQGLLFVPQTSHLYVANAEDGFVHVFDVAGAEDDWKRLASIDLGDEADNLRYDAGESCVWVGYGEGGLAMIRDGVTSAEIRHETSRSCACGAHPESFQLEQLGPRVFVNVADEKLVQVVDRRSGVELARWPLPTGLGSNFPMCLDEERQRLYVGVRQPLAESCVLVLDTNSGRCIARVPCSGDMDDLFLDIERGRIYVVSGLGVVSVIDARRLALLGEVETAIGARTGFMVPSRNSLYVAAPATASTPARLIVLAARD